MRRNNPSRGPGRDGRRRGVSLPPQEGLLPSSSSCPTTMRPATAAMTAKENDVLDVEKEKIMEGDKIAPGDETMEQGFISTEIIRQGESPSCTATETPFLTSSSPTTCRGSSITTGENKKDRHDGVEEKETSGEKDDVRNMGSPHDKSKKEEERQVEPLPDAVPTTILSPALSSLEATEKVYAELCGICFTQVETARNPRGILNSCQHVFCAFCIREWGKQTNICPSCKCRFTRIEIPEGPNRARQVVKVRRKNYSNWQSTEDSEEEGDETRASTSSSSREGTLHFWCWVCQGSENPLQMIFCDRRECTFVAHWECVGLAHRPLTFLCPSCHQDESLHPSCDIVEGEKKKEGDEGESSSPPHTRHSTSENRKRERQDAVEESGDALSSHPHSAPSSSPAAAAAAAVVPQFRRVYVGGEPVFELVSSNPSPSSFHESTNLHLPPPVTTSRTRSRNPPHSSPPHQRRRGGSLPHENAHPSNHRRSTNALLTSATTTTVRRTTTTSTPITEEENPPPSPSFHTNNEQSGMSRRGEGEKGNGRALPLPFFSPSIASLPSPLATGYPHPHHPSHGEDEDDPLYFLKPSSHTLASRGALRSWKSEHPEVSFHPTASFSSCPSSTFAPFGASCSPGHTTTTPTTGKLSRGSPTPFSVATSSPIALRECASPSCYFSAPISTSPSPSTGSCIPAHVPAPFERPLSRLIASWSSSSSPRYSSKRTEKEGNNSNNVNNTITRTPLHSFHYPRFSAHDDADSRRMEDSGGKREGNRAELSSSSSSSGTGAAVHIRPSTSTSSSSPLIILSERQQRQMQLEDPNQRRLLVERMTRDWAVDMVEVLRQRHFIDRHRQVSLLSATSTSPYRMSGPPSSSTSAAVAAEEEAKLWNEAMNACRPQVESTLRYELLQLRLKRERALRIEAKREAAALDKLARLIAAHRDRNHPMVRQRESRNEGGGGEGGPEGTSLVPITSPAFPTTSTTRMGG